MEKIPKQKKANTLDFVELVIGAIIAWIADKTLNSLLKTIRRRMSAKKDSSKEAGNLREFGEKLIHLSARVLDVDPTEVEFSIYHNVDKYGPGFKGLVKSMTEFVLYAFHKRELNISLP
jgi:hypothetical protein